MKSTSILLLMIFAAANAAASDYEEVRELGLGSRGIDTLRVDNGSGYVEIVGVDGLDEISITATLVLEDTGAEKAKKIIESDLVLTLDENSDSVVLTAYFERKGLFNFGSSGLVNLDIRMPAECISIWMTVPVRSRSTVCMVIFPSMMDQDRSRWRTLAVR